MYILFPILYVGRGSQGLQYVVCSQRHLRGWIEAWKEHNLASSWKDIKLYIVQQPWEWALKVRAKDASQGDHNKADRIGEVGEASGEDCLAAWKRGSITLLGAEGIEAL